MRVDLSADARDFEAVIIEQGIPLLDKSNASYRVLQKWLGRLVAEPEWNGDSVDFYVCDDEKARLNDVRCEPATTEDLRRSRELKQDLDELANRLKQITPGPKEAELHAALLRHFQKLTLESSPAQAQGGCYFFKYRDANVWRLVWAWGYQRRDLAPGSPTICTNPNCALLFARRGDGGHTCPDCEKGIGGTRTRPGKPRWRRTAMIAVMLLVAAAVGWVLRDWIIPPTDPLPPPVAGLQATPKQWTGPVGGQVRYEAVLYEEGQEEDVTTQVTCVAENPKVFRFDRLGSTATARSPGSTPVHVYLEDQVAHATVEVLPPRNPDTIAVKPSEVTLGVGTTERLRVIGEFADGQNEADLTKAAEWKVADTGFVYCNDGQLEGKAQGETTVIARYRATPGDEFVECKAKVIVVDEQYQSLELVIHPSSITQGKTARVDARVATASGEKRSVWNSSELKLERPHPRQLAKREKDYLHAVNVGNGTLKASFRDLTDSSDFQVKKDVGVAIFEVHPNPLDLVTGETDELAVTSTSSDPIRLASSDSHVVEVLSGTRVVGRAPGKAEITVTQEAREKTIDAEVKDAAIESIRFVPERVSVPVDGSKALRLVGLCEKDQEVDLVPDRIVWEELPASTFVDFNLDTLEIGGRLPTGVSPQMLVARWGEHTATAAIDVTAPPVKIELSPSGDVSLPIGQTARLYAWASYGGGRRVKIPPGRLEWELDPETVAGLVLDRGRAAVRATAAGAGPLKVCAVYQGVESNSVEFTSTDAETTIEILTDRSLFFVGAAGQFRALIAQPIGAQVGAGEPSGKATAIGEAADAFLEGVRFNSSDPLVLALDDRSGAYRALTPGAVTVTAEHEETNASAQREIEVVDWEKVNLILRPAEFKLLVGGRQSLELFVTDGERKEKMPWASDTDDVRLGIAQRAAVRWKPPELIGFSPADPFLVTASYGGKTAQSVVEVLPQPAAGESAIRIDPATANLAPGQPLSPKVERQLPGDGDQWVEVDPLKVRWTVPDSIHWTPPSADLRPQLTPSESAEGKVELQAEHAGLKATLTIDVTSEPEGPESPEDLWVAREPEGEHLPVGRQQRYAPMIGKGPQAQRAAGVQWPSAFENDYVRWEPPVLFAKRAGHEERLHAIVGKWRVRFSTRTVEPPGPVEPVKPKASEVRIVCDHPTPITMPLRARFDKFRVEALSSGFPPSDVTHQATLHVKCGDPSQPPVTVEQGRLVAQTPGSAVVFAEYNGVRSAEGLPLEVVDRVEFTEIEVVPAELNLAAGKSDDLHAYGYTGVGPTRQSVGDISELGGLTWESDHPEIVQTDGPHLTGKSVGQAKVTVSAGSAAATADVTVSEPGTIGIQGNLQPDLLRLRVGETKRLGRDVTMVSGDQDLSDQMEVLSSAPSIVRYNRDNRSLVGVSPGETELDIAAGGHRFTLPVVVSDEVDRDGTIVIEPNSGTLAVGERRQLRLFLVNDSGRIDRTSSALFVNETEDTLAVRGNVIAGIAPGPATVKGGLLGIGTASATFTVRDEQFDRLHVVPGSLRLSVGERRRFRVMARGPNGQRDVTGHVDLKTVAGGQNPDAIELSGSDSVRGVAPGSANIQVSWGDLAASPAPVVVSDDPLTGLAIEPSETTIAVGEAARFSVSARQRNRNRSLTSDDGVELRVADPSIASPLRDLMVRGRNEGTTAVTAVFGPHRATAQLHVTSEGDLPPAPWRGLRFIPDVLTLQLGVPGASVRVVKVNAEGQIEDVDHRTKVQVTDPGIAEVSWTASGPVFVAKREGRTTATATLGEGPSRLETERRLLIDVVDPLKPGPSQSRTRLEVSPDPVRLEVGETGGFSRVQIVPGAGGPPIDVDYRVRTRTTDDSSIVVVNDGKILRGVGRGQAQVTVVPNVPDDRYSDLSTNVAVYVKPRDDGGPGRGKGSRLVLTGPSRTTVGSDARYRVEVVGAGSPRDVTNDGASLVLDHGQESRADLQPGCRVIARRPGTVNVRARHRDRISNMLPLVIDEIARDFERIVLEMSPRPFVIGESRSYRLWGYPPGRRPRQELTGRVGDSATVAVRVTEPSGDTTIVSHNPPRLVAQSTGEFLLGAQFGDLTAEPLDLVIIKGDPENLRLRAEPSAITLRPGQHTQRLEAIARSPHAPDEWPVDTQWSSEDEKIVAPDPEVPGRFVGKAPGETRLKATYGGLEAFVNVTVEGDPFQRVALQKQPEWDPSRRFAVVIDIEADGMGPAGLEYRVFPVGNPEGGQWKRASVSDGDAKIQLTGPYLREGPSGTVYNVHIEARNAERKTVARYPLPFVLSEREIDQRAEVKPEG